MNKKIKNKDSQQIDFSQSEIDRSTIKKQQELKQKESTKLKARYNTIVQFLKEQGYDEPDQLISTLWQVYQQIEPTNEHLKPSEKEYFYKPKTKEKYLNCFKVLFDVLIRLNKRIDEKQHFNEFWNHCLEYLRKCNEPELANVFEDTRSQFRQMTLNYWRKAYNGDPDKLRHMFNCFRSCFGIYGNDEACRIYDPNEQIFDWKRIEKCHESLYQEVV